MNIYEIKDRLLKQEKAVFSLNEIAKIIGKSKNIAGVYANRMLKKEILFKAEKNKFTLSEDVFVIASQLIFPSYLGFSTALYLYNIIPQVADKIYVVSSKKKRRMKLFGTEIIFVKVGSELMFGYKKIKKENSIIFISDIEKTIIDCLSFNKYCNLLIVVEALRKADIKKLEYYLSLVNREYVNRKAGYLLDCLEIRHSIKRKTNTVYKLNPSRKNNGKFNKKWFLYVNEGLK